MQRRPAALVDALQQAQRAEADRLVRERVAQVLHDVERHRHVQPRQENRKSKNTKPYPLKVCLVTDNDLDSMGDEVSIVYEGQTIKFCCAPCEKKFRQNPAKYLAKLAPKLSEKNKPAGLVRQKI